MNDQKTTPPQDPASESEKKFTLVLPVELMDKLNRVAAGMNPKTTRNFLIESILTEAVESNFSPGSPPGD